MEILRTSDHYFKNLEDYSFKENYVHLNHDGHLLRMHYVDEGPPQAPVVLLLHGEPSWSYLYRKTIQALTDAGYRSIAPDLMGCGKSDKPGAREVYTYENHVRWLNAFVQQLKLKNIALVCQDWGGFLGLRLVASHPEIFSCVFASNTGLPTGEVELSKEFHQWQKYSQEIEAFNVSEIIQKGCATQLSENVKRAYEAPFPDEFYKLGVRQFPVLVPTQSQDPSAIENRNAWMKLIRFSKPFITFFAEDDPITFGNDLAFQKHIPGAQGQAHQRVPRAGHFIQEDVPDYFSETLLNFLTAYHGANY